MLENEDFRQSVLYEFSASESYGVFNLHKLKKINQLLPDNYWFDLLYESISKSGLGRSLVFARKVYPDGIWWSALIY
jgi:hypothetical protein